MGAEGINRLRSALRLSQRRLCVLAQKDGVQVSQAAISLMEAGKQPIDRRYAQWLERRVYGRWLCVAGMPKKVLAWKIRNREEYSVGCKEWGDELSY